MAVKFNKEMLLKHRFWVMLGVAVTLTLVGIMILELSEAEGRVKMASILKEGKSTKATESPKTIAGFKAAADVAKKHETQVWQEAYDPQAPLFTWPDPIEKKFDFANGYFANEVKITKLADANPKKWKEAAKNWPPDNPNLIHGAFLKQEDDWFEIKDRNGEKKKFFLTRRIDKIQGEDGKPVSFRDMPKAAEKKMLAVGYQRGKYFGDSLTRAEAGVFKDSYKDQISPLLKSVDPFDNKGNGVVQLRGWLYDKDSLPHETLQSFSFVRYVAADWNKEIKINDEITREAWIAQEDIWIQREIYRMIKSANDGVSQFTPLFKGKNDLRNEAYAFQNSYFDLELKLDKDDALSFKIKNRLPRKQSIDLKFKVLLNNAKPPKEEVIEISGFPLMPAGTKGAGEKDRDYFIKTFKKEKDERTGIYAVQQVLSWQTAAIKRIDQISIGSVDGGDVAHSQRTASVPLRPFDEKDMLVRAGSDPGKGVTPKVGSADKTKSKGGKKMPPGVKKGGGGGAAPVAMAGSNQGAIQMGLWTDRYVEVSEQARRLPVAVVLIVDQGHVDRVLTAFNNSKLRFLDTQVLLNQYSGSLQPPVPEDKVDAPPRPAFPGFGPKGGLPLAPKVADPGAGADLETNMELVIYGIVTLYQRYPPRPPLPPLDTK